MRMKNVTLRYDCIGNWSNSSDWWWEEGVKIGWRLVYSDFLFFVPKFWDHESCMIWNMVLEKVSKVIWRGKAWFCEKRLEIHMLEFHAISGAHKTSTLILPISDYFSCRILHRVRSATNFCCFFCHLCLRLFFIYVFLTCLIWPY